MYRNWEVRLRFTARRNRYLETGSVNLNNEVQIPTHGNGISEYGAKVCKYQVL